MLPLIVGLHVACYGAYKDCLYENFIVRRFIREIALSIFITLILFLIYPSLFISEKSFMVFTFILIISRIVTEIYKLFIRVEDQTQYKIPSQVHLFRSVVKARKHRFLLSSVVLFFLTLGVFLTYMIDAMQVSTQIEGFFTGLIAGILIALGGAYKDGFFEGFSFRKFFRSPVITSICALLISSATSNPLVLFFASMGFERMIVEYYKGFIKSGYVPGKFKAEKPIYTNWLAKRKIFILPYTLTWIVMLILIVS